MKTENTEDAELKIQIKVEYNTPWWKMTWKSGKKEPDARFLHNLLPFLLPENSSVASCFPVADITV